LEISQVLNTLQLTEMPPSDVLEELVEDEVFHLRDYFLRNPVVKQLYTARVRKLNKLLEIQKHYINNKECKSSEVSESIKLVGSDFLEVLQDFEKNQSNLRGQLAATLTIWRLIEIVETLIQLQQEYEKQFKLIFEKNFSGFKASVPVKLSDHLATGEVIRFLQQKDLEAARPSIEKEYSRILLIP
tara:strand:- start:30021 stop:30578 length:558 start_codon:yes stop_codon:yes gene_type:complete